MANLDMFSAMGIKPRRSPRTMMRVVDAGQSAHGMVIQFECGKCGHNTGWIKDEKTVSENRRGMPCPECNKWN